ncbi:ARM repeat-containing protein [Backusella circina FSU 941]|nr:ARM repeat-containing protein [Backusella circina FSU 941]
MGKQPRKLRKPRSSNNPLGVNAAIQQGLSEQPTLSANDVLPVVNKLSSPTANERIWAVASISQLIMSNSANLKLVYSNGLVDSLIKLLGDEQREVVEETLGTLRNLCTVDPDIAQEYFTKDILTPLAAMLPQIASIIDLVLKDAPLADTADHDRRSSIWDVAENFIYIIWSLSEASDKAIKAVNQLNIVNFLISFLTAADQCPNQVVVAAGQCLTTLTDDNKDIQKEFEGHPEYTQLLLDVLQKYQTMDKMLVRILACAVLMNLRDIVQSNNNVEDLNKIVLPILNASLDFNIQNTSNEVIQAMQSGNVTKHEEESTEILPKPKQPLTKEDILLKTVEDRLTTLQLSLELLAGICLQDENEDGWQDAGAEDEDADMDAEGMVDNLNEDNVDDFLREAETLGDNTFNAVDEETVRSNPVLHTFTTDILPKLIQLATPTPLSFPATNETAVITQGLDLTHQRALECINNFLLAMNEIPSKFWFKEQVNDATQAWRWLFNTANVVGAAPASSEERNDILEAIVGCLWALGRGLGQNIPLEPSDVCSLCGAYQASTSESMQVKIIGCLGPIALRQGDINTNKDIGTFIIQVLNDINNKKTHADAAVEALNLIFDVYSDCAFDYDEPVYVKGKFNQQLKQILPSFRAVVKAIDRRKNYDLRNRCDEALMNLVAFIKYKASERKA